MTKGFEWFVAWRYLRDQGKRSGYVALLLGGLLFVAAGVLIAVSLRTPPPHPLEIIEGGRDWRQIYQLSGVIALALGVLVGVFGYLRTLQSFFTTVSTYGVFLGTAALVIVLSVMNGFEEDLRLKILGSNAHLLVTKEDGAFTEWREIEKKLDGVPGIVAHTPYVSSEVVVASNSNYQGVIIKGIDPATAGLVTDLAKNLEEGETLDALWPRKGGKGEKTPAEPATPPDGEAPPEDFSGEDEEGPPIDFSGGADELVEDPLERDAGLDIRALAPVEIGAPMPPPRHRPIPKDPRVEALDGILIGRELAKDLHAYVGQEVQVISPLGQDTPAGQMPRVRPYRVAGIFFSGMYEYDTKHVYVTMPSLQRFLGLGDEAGGIEIKVTDSNDTGPVVARIKTRLGPGYRVQDWQEINRSLFSALKLEKIAMFLVLTIIILVASFSIVSNLIMVVVEKAKEIAILKSMGAGDGSVMRVFMIEGIYIGAMGTVFGLLVGIATCWALGRFGLPLDSNVYYIDQLPVAMDPMAIVAVSFAGVAISFIATIYPSYIAARLRPVDGLRYE